MTASLSRDRAPSTLLSLLLLALVAANLVAPAAAQGRARVSEILSIVKDKGDRAPVALFNELGTIGTSSSFNALQQCVDEVKSEYRKRAAFTAMRHFLVDDDLGGKALSLVERTARGKKGAEARAAAAALSNFGDPAQDALMRVATGAKDDVARAHGLKGVRDELARRADVKSLDVVLEAWRSPQSGTVEHTYELIRAFNSKDAFDRLTKFVGSKKSPRPLVTAVVTAMGGHPRTAKEVVAKGAERVLIRAAQSKDPIVQYQALTAMARRGGVEDDRLVERLAKSKDPIVRRAAMVVAVRGKSDGFDPIALSQDSDAVTRQVAALALAEDGSTPAMDALHRLLGDEDPLVRGAAIQQVGRRRDVNSIPILIGRLDKETGRLRGQVRYVLTLMTAKDLGMRVGAWRSFWKAEGKDFVVPSYEEAKKKAEERQKRKSSGETRVAFYGLDIISNRFALVIDTSGSMEAKTKSYVEKTRLEVAQEQLEDTIARIQNGVLFNVIAFSGAAHPMEDGLVKMDDSTREDALFFSGDLRAGGGTNIYDALDAAFDDERVDTIYLMSDGAPSAGEITDVTTLREEIERINSVRGVVIHCIAVGQDHPLLRALAEDSGGQYVRVD